MSVEKIIAALDVPTADEAREIIERLNGEVGAFKIGLQLFTSAGAPFVREILRGGNKVFLDLKFHDIPNTVAKASVEAARLGVWMFNLHALGGGEMLRRAVEETREVCHKENLTQPKIIAVTVLTSSTDETLREIGVGESAEAQVLRLAHLAKTCGLDGVVASPLETRLIRREIENRNFMIVTPGVRPHFQNSFSCDDQKRTMTPAEALSAGADYLVIGRPILQAEDPVGAARRIVREIEETTKEAVT
jgi:orotidine-5'-phosphate decarboxylase